MDKKKIYVEKIFPELKKKENYKKLLIDNESLMYVTNFRDSAFITTAICNHIGRIKDAASSIIVDATGGVGGDTISFASKFFKVISIEMDETRYEFLANNIKMYEFTNVLDIKGDSLSIIPKLSNIDIVYIDPPWGGKAYKNKTNLRLKIDDRELESIVCEFLSIDKMLCVPKIIGMKLPKNYDLIFLYSQIKTKFKSVRVYTYQLPKMYLIIIENFKITS